MTLLPQTLEGLAPLPLPLSGTGTASARSALPLGSLASASTSAAALASSADAPIQLHNVTLVVPQQDFLALLTLATDGSVRPCVDGAVLQLAAQLSANISRLALAPQQNLSSLWRAVQLSGYTGWGVNASQLVVRPQAAVPEALVAACVPAVPAPPSSDGASPSSPSSSGLSGGAIAGIVVGSVVGGALLLAAAAVLIRRRRHDRCAASVLESPVASARLPQCAHKTQSPA